MPSTDGLDEQRRYGDAYADMTAHLRSAATIAEGVPYAFGYLANVVKRPGTYEPASLAAIARGLEDAIRDHRNTMIDQMNKGMNAR